MRTSSTRLTSAWRTSRTSAAATGSARRSRSSTPQRRQSARACQLAHTPSPTAAVCRRLSALPPPPSRHHYPSTSPRAPLDSPFAPAAFQQMDVDYVIGAPHPTLLRNAPPQVAMVRMFGVTSEGAPPPAGLPVSEKPRLLCPIRSRAQSADAAAPRHTSLHSTTSDGPCPRARTQRQPPPLHPQATASAATSTASPPTFTAPSPPASAPTTSTASAKRSTCAPMPSAAPPVASLAPAPPHRARRLARPRPAAAVKITVPLRRPRAPPSSPRVRPPRTASPRPPRRGRSSRSTSCPSKPSASRRSGATSGRRTARSSKSPSCFPPWSPPPAPSSRGRAAGHTHPLLPPPRPMPHRSTPALAREP